ncbi:MAG TPA: LysM peptidoglycan-binding domain-containing M23 family metallopeptidase [Ktedonobacterales bacterium]|jgi:murein DD-endopeptidase MepM/ murein hydrolase activator NlpD
MSGRSHGTHDDWESEEVESARGRSDRRYDDTGDYTAQHARGGARESGYTDYDEAYGDDSMMVSAYGGALVPLGERGLEDADDLSAELPATGPFVIPGNGVSVSASLVPRRPRPLAQRVAVMTLAACVVASALFAVVPLGSGGVDAASSVSPLQALSGAVVWHQAVGFFWYVAQTGDTPEGLAKHFGCQVGGIYELNGLLSGQELQLGKAYKIPTDANYGQYFQPPSYVVSGGGYGTTTYGNSPWNSLAGQPPVGAICGPAPSGSGANMGGYDLASFDLKAPNWNAYWARGFSWYHNGVDLDNPMGTPIHAAQAGEVIFAGWDPGGGGWTVKINNCHHISTFYAHNEKLLVKVHDMVHVGDVISLEGSTGWSTGPHCHLTVEWDNVPVDPLLFFQGPTSNWIYNITHFTPDH